MRYVPCVRYSLLATRQSKTAAAAAGVGNLVSSIKGVLLAILLDAGRAQSGKAMLVDRVLPGQEFLDRQRIAAARFFERQQSAANGGNYFRFAADAPTLRPRCRQIGDGQGG